jgi:5-methyltetrahydrofolate--homocysteine methyltransferase
MPETHASLSRRLAERALLLDGGLGSLFIAAGLAAGRAPEHWLFDHPERVVDAHRRYAAAGSDILHAVTFGGSPPKLAAAGLGGRCREVHAVAVALARAGAGGRALVAVDVGPTGLLLPPVGAAREDELQAAFREQIEAAAAAGADLVDIETMYDLREALAAVRAAAEVGVPAFASMTFDRRRRGCFTIMGDRIGPSLAALAAAGAVAVGMNCTVDSGPMVDMVREAVQAVAAPIVAQPNAGQPRATAEGVVYDARPAPFVADLMAMVDAGARAVGGCCGTDPDFIAAARAALDARAGAPAGGPPRAGEGGR